MFNFFKKAKMKLCKHKNLEYLGVQETGDNNKYIFLWSCRECGSTIALNKKQMIKAIQKKIKKDKKCIKDLKGGKNDR